MKNDPATAVSRSKLLLPRPKHDHIQGSLDAPIALVEYGDYECPYCGQAYPIVKVIQERLGGRLRFAFRNFPLTNSHPHAEHAAEADPPIAFFLETAVQSSKSRLRLSRDSLSPQEMTPNLATLFVIVITIRVNV